MGPAVAERLLGLKPSAVINCAAYTQVDRAEAEPERCRAVNAGGRRASSPGLRSTKLPVGPDQHGLCLRRAAAGRRSPLARRRSDRAARRLCQDENSKASGSPPDIPKHLIVRTCGLYARRSDDQAVNFVKNDAARGGPSVRSCESSTISVAHRPTYRIWRERSFFC